MFAWKLLLIWLVAGCQLGARIRDNNGLVLPFMKNTANECYYLDEFMPVPNSVVSGKSGSLSLRYYTYNSAIYKDWPEQQVILSFYSQDDRCWTLFEEYFVAE